MELQIKQEINAPADRVWDIVGRQFATVDKWSRAVATSRTLTMGEIPAGLQPAPAAPVPGRATPNPFGELKEVLTAYSDDARTFTFVATGLPPIIRQAQNTTRVQALGPGKSLVTFDVKMVPWGIFKVIDPLLRRRFATSARGPAGVMQDLKAYAESGQLPA